VQIFAFIFDLFFVSFRNKRLNIVYEESVTVTHVAPKAAPVQINNDVIRVSSLNDFMVGSFSMKS